MPDKTQEIDFVPITGNDESNYIFINGLLAGNHNLNWNRHVIAWGGNDLIVFDAYVDWLPPIHLSDELRTVHFDGGSGADTVSLSPTDYSITVNLTLGTGEVHIPSYFFEEDGQQQYNPMSVFLEFDSIENIFGGNADDILHGNAQANVLSGGFGNDDIWGWDGADTLHGGGGNDELYGGDGHDLMTGGQGWDYLYGEDGNDTLEGGAGDDALFGGAGNDTLIGGAGNNYIDGGAGLDFVKYVSNGDVYVNLNTGVATSADSNDDLYNIERVHTAGGNDTVIGDGAINVIWLGDGIDFAFGHGGADTIKGHDGEDWLFGDEGNDSLWGGNQNDKLYGGTGNDGLHGGKHDDLLFGDAGNDRLNGDNGDDELYGGDGDDELNGGLGKDYLDGGEGDDILSGGNQDDIVVVGDGLDLIHTGSGSDTLYFKAGQWGLDHVTDFDTGADYFAFEEGYFESVGPMQDVLRAVDLGDGNAALYIQLEDGRIDYLLFMDNVQASAIHHRIEQGTLVKPPEANGTFDVFQFERNDMPGESFSDLFLV